MSAVREVGGFTGTFEAALIDDSLLFRRLFTINRFGSVTTKRLWDGFPGSPFLIGTFTARLPQSGRACMICPGL